MATLNTFGFTPRKGRTSSHHLPAKVLDRNQSVAFTQPIDIKPMLASPHNNNQHNNKNTQTRKTVAKKPNKKIQSNQKNNYKITQYFNTSTNTTPMDIDNTEEEVEKTCIIRKKVPFLTLFNEIENEYIQELLLFDEEEEEQDSYHIKSKSKCRRFSQIEDEEDTPMIIKRQKTTLDTDLSSVMSRFLNIQSNIILSTTPTTRIECLNDYKYEEEEEDLKRYLRYKMSKEESSLFVLQITQEYLS